MPPKCKTSRENASSNASVCGKPERGPINALRGARGRGLRGEAPVGSKTTMAAPYEVSIAALASVFLRSKRTAERLIDRWFIQSHATDFMKLLPFFYQTAPKNNLVKAPKK